MDYMDYLIIWAIFVICFLLSLYIGRRKDITYDDYEDGTVEPIPELDSSRWMSAQQKPFVTALYKTRFIRKGVVGHETMYWQGSISQWVYPDNGIPAMIQDRMWLDPSPWLKPVKTNAQ